jgi:ABC-type antimicrobial peptide transport system permease subunit
MIVGFGVFGTMVMMVLERKKELAVMVAVGMRRTKLAFMVFMETVFISIISVAAGILSSLPLLLYFKANPIPAGDSFADLFEQWGLESAYTFSTSPGIFLSQSWVTLIIACAAIIYPLFLIAKLNVLKTFRS